MPAKITTSATLGVVGRLDAIETKLAQLESLAKKRRLHKIHTSRKGFWDRPLNERDLAAAAYNRAVAAILDGDGTKDLIAAYTESLRESVQSARENRERFKNAPIAQLYPAPGATPYLRREDCLKIIAEVLYTCGNEGLTTLAGMGLAADRMAGEEPD